MGGFIAGSSAAYAALVGTALVLAVLGFGSTVVNTVAGLMPAASLMVALLTYVLQVVLMALVFAALSGSGLLDDTLDREWLAGVVIGGTFVWLTAQVVLTTRFDPRLRPAGGGLRGAGRQRCRTPHRGG